MAFRFRKSIRIFPGVRLNIGKNGISSVSIGRPGATMNIGQHGVRRTIGIPGTGISYTAYSRYDESSQAVERERSVSWWAMLFAICLIAGSCFVCVRVAAHEDIDKTASAPTDASIASEDDVTPTVCTVPNAAEYGGQTVSGHCKPLSQCGTYFEGFCAGPKNIVCCVDAVPPGRPPTTAMKPVKPKGKRGNRQGASEKPKKDAPPVLEATEAVGTGTQSVDAAVVETSPPENSSDVAEDEPLIPPPTDCVRAWKLLDRLEACSAIDGLERSALRQQAEHSKKFWATRQGTINNALRDVIAKECADQAARVSAQCRW
jgi:hypothetical protein